MIVTIIIFLVAIISLFGMLVFRAWEIKTARLEKPIESRNIFPIIYFRQVEKIMLYLTKHIIQWIVLVLAKYWFILSTRTKKWIFKKLPKINEFFKTQTKKNVIPKKTFVGKAILESKIKIQKIKERVKKDHEEKFEK